MKQYDRVRFKPEYIEQYGTGTFVITDFYHGNVCLKGLSVPYEHEVDPSYLDIVKEFSAEDYEGATYVYPVGALPGKTFLLYFVECRLPDGWIAGIKSVTDGKLIQAALGLLEVYKESEQHPPATNSPADAIQVGGRYYKNMTLQPWDVMKAWYPAEEYRGFLKLNALKYLARAGKKEGNSELQDLKKAVHYLQKLIEEIEGANSSN